eukprot:6245091-Heterocapsa_arctica.AAC.1
MENPADPGPSYPPISPTPEAEEVQGLTGAKDDRFDQCAHGLYVRGQLQIHLYLMPSFVASTKVEWGHE